MTKTIYVREVFTNETAGYRCGDSGVYEAFTDDIGRLFRAMQKEHGRCTSKVYIDRDGGAVHIGWHFEKRQQYEDTGRHGRPPKFYVAGCWVELHTAPPTVTRQVHLLNIAEGGEV